MSLISPQEFISKTFSRESAPHEHTVRRWIINGALPGRRIGKRYYVDEIALASNGDPLLEKILRHVPRAA